MECGRLALTRQDFLFLFIDWKRNKIEKNTSKRARLPFPKLRQDDQRRESQDQGPNIQKVDLDENEKYIPGKEEKDRL